MITKEITLCGQHITLGYCYASEIAYKEMSGEDMFDYAKHAIESIQEQRDPDIKKTIFAIIACMMAFYDDETQKAPIKDTDIMKQASPVEIGTAFISIIEMRQKFYNVPTGEPEENKAGKPKNV